MHPYIQHQLTDDRIAGMHGQAGRQRIARAALRARRATRRPAAQPGTGPGSLFHRVLPALLASGGQRRQQGALAAQAPQGLRT